MRHAVKILYLPNYNLAAWGALAYAKPGDAGFDLRAAIEEPITLNRGHPVIVPAGFKIALPNHPDPYFTYELQIRPRSGLAAKLGVTVLNSPGTVDFGYRGEVGVILYLAKKTGGLSPAYDGDVVEIQPGERIAQGVLSIVPVAKFEVVSDEAALGNTVRGAGGFGSTGS
jgi:dUTP pyrophosphatase